MLRIKSLLLRHADSLILALILSFLFFRNYTPATYLIGWDNLLPELNIFANIKRSLLAVWQEYQGLGLVGGNAHATELIRQILILPLTFILPQNLIRYFWHFTMITLGTFGISHGLKKHFRLPAWVALLSSLFYLLNFGSVQNFWVPFEAFSTFWGFFPWLIFSAWNYLKKPDKPSLIRVLILNLLATPAFFIPTNFIVYLLCLTCLFLSFLIKNHRPLNLQPLFKFSLALILINSFWLLPFFYFFKNDLHHPQLSFVNIMSTQETLDRNQRRGTFPDFLLLRSFYYDYQSNSNFLMNPWLAHFSNHFYLIAGFILSAFVLIGLFSLLKKNQKHSFEKLSLILLFLLSTIALASASFPFNLINQFLHQSPLLSQVFRAPFTKFVVPAAFTFSLLTAFSFNAVNSVFAQLKYSPKKSQILIYVIYLLLLAAFSLPSFKGNYFSPDVRLSLPPEYHQLFDYFQKQSPNSRIANLPSGNFWGWNNYRFGLIGSGFIWYGIEQPILDRTFDVWNLKNENYYWEIDNAVQRRDSHLLSQVFRKYAVEYVIFDNNLYFPFDRIYAKSSTPTKDLLKNIPDLSLVEQFGQISVYRFSGSPSSAHLIPSADQSDQLPYAIKRFSSEIALQPQIENNQVKLNGTITDFDPQNRLYHQNLLTVNHTPLLPPYQNYHDSNNGFVRLSDYDNNHLTSWHFAEVGFNQPYLLAIESRHIQGHPLRFSAFQSEYRFKFIETKLPDNPDWHTSWYYIPAMETENFSPGLVLLFQNASYNHTSTVNDVRSIKLYPTSLDISFNYPASPKTPLSTKSNIFIHQIDLTDSANISNQYLVLPQSFHPGWLAFSLNNLKPTFLKNHFPVNNWANGWLLPEDLTNQNPTIYVLFWPQLLQFLGFFLLPLPFTYTLLHKNNL